MGPADRSSVQAGRGPLRQGRRGVQTAALLLLLLFGTTTLVLCQFLAFARAEASSEIDGPKVVLTEEVKGGEKTEKGDDVDEAPIAPVLPPVLLRRLSETIATPTTTTTTTTTAAAAAATDSGDEATSALRGASRAPLPPLPTSSSSDVSRQAPTRRLVSPAVVNMVVNAMVYPAMFYPLKESIKSLYFSVRKPHKKHWAPEVQWHLPHCLLEIRFSLGYEFEVLRKVSPKTFGVFFSRKTGRLKLRWSDRSSFSTLWTKPRMEVTDFVASPWCRYNEATAYYDLFMRDGAVEAALVQFERLEARSYKLHPISKEEDFRPVIESHFVSDAEREAFTEAAVPDKVMGWDATRCMFQLVHRGPPGSHVVQWNELSMRGLLRIIDVEQRAVVVNKPMHPSCTYDDGKTLEVGEVTLKDGKRKIIGFTRVINTPDLEAPPDLVEVKRRQQEELMDAVEEEKKKSS